jgi:hypothetical protein
VHLLDLPGRHPVGCRATSPAAPSTAARADRAYPDGHTIWIDFLDWNARQARVRIMEKLEFSRFPTTIIAADVSSFARKRVQV